MSLQTLITAHESATFDNAPSGFVLSTAAEGAGRIYEFVGEKPLSHTGTTACNNRGGLEIKSTGGVLSEAVFDTAKKFAFEAKIEKSDLSTGVLFVGVTAASTISTTVPLGSNAVANDSIGFYITSGDLDAVIPTSKKGSASQVDKASVAISEGVYVRLGIKYDPADRGIRFFVDGNEVAQEATAVPAAGTLLRAAVAQPTAGVTNIVNCDYVAVAVKR